MTASVADLHAGKAIFPLAEKHILFDVKVTYAVPCREHLCPGSYRQTLGLMYPTQCAPLTGALSPQTAAAAVNWKPSPEPCGLWR